MADKRKAEIVWGVRQYGTLLPFLMASTRRGAIKEARDYWRWDNTLAPWAKLRRHGYTVHKLEVRDAR